MTNSIEGAQMELTPPGSDVSQAEQDRWLKGVIPGSRTYFVADNAQSLMTPIYDYERKAYVSRFNPAATISPLAARLLAASNGLHSSPTDGTPASEPGTTKHAGFRFSWSK